MRPSPVGVRSCFISFPALAAALFLSTVTGASLAADPPAVSDPAADNAAGPVAAAADNGWVDRTHLRVERNLFDTVAWFDRFFGDERMEVTDRPDSFLRWMNELRWDEDEHFSFRSTVRASLRLPRLKKRWRLVFSGETRGDPNAVTQEDPGNPGLDVGNRARAGSTELIYDLFRTPRSAFDVGAGVRVKLPPDAFVRARFQHARPVGLETLGRLTVITFWDALDGFGESNQVDLERWLAPPTLLRWSNSLAISENHPGWTWRTELTLLQKLSPKSVVTFAGGASGSSRPAWIARDYRVLARYRRNVWRKWLFLEGEPGIRWPRSEDGSRKPVWGATLRAEILFTGEGPDPRDGGETGP